MRRLLLLLVVVLLFAQACEENGDPPVATPGNGQAPPPGQAQAGQSGAGTPVSGGAIAVPNASFDPGSFTLRLERVAEGFANPLYVTNAGDGSGRLFVVEQAGLIAIVEDGRKLAQPFLDVRPLVRAGGEQGLLGLVFHPRYRENGRFFINYTARNSDNTVAEYRVSGDPNRAEGQAVQILLAIPDYASNHNAGMLAFGPDGYLYVGTGDGGGAGDPQGNGQKLGALLGKMLRLDVNGAQPYAIPPTNPFAGREDVRPEIWAYGLRNPWRYSFDRATGDLYIADVGQNGYEEINFQAADSTGGENYGWNRMEGMHCFRADRCEQTGMTLPVVEYGREQGCSVTGGFVYRGTAQPALTGAYFYADFCSGRIWSAHRGPDGGWTTTELLQPEMQISSFGEDEAGELFLTDFRSGAVYQLVTTGQ